MEAVQTNCLAVVVIDLEVLFQIMICLFGLTITFRVISRSEVESHVQCSCEGLEEVGHEFSSMIEGDVAWNTMLGEDMENKELCELWRDDGIVSQDEK